MFQISNNIRENFPQCKIQNYKNKNLIELSWMCFLVFGKLRVSFGSLRKSSEEFERLSEVIEDFRVIRDLQKDWSDFWYYSENLLWCFFFFRVMNDELIGYLRYYTASGRELCKIYLSVEKFLPTGFYIFWFNPIGRTNFQIFSQSVNQLVFQLLAEYYVWSALNFTKKLETNRPI